MDNLSYTPNYQDTSWQNKSGSAITMQDILNAGYTFDQAYSLIGGPNHDGGANYIAYFGSLPDAAKAMNMTPNTSGTPTPVTYSQLKNAGWNDAIISSALGGNAIDTNRPYHLDTTGKPVYEDTNKNSGYAPSISSPEGQANIAALNNNAGPLPAATSSSSGSSSTTQPKPFGIENITQTLNVGSQGTQVQELQKYLSGLGYVGADGKPLKADGIYGPETKAAVSQFQSKNGLTADGIFGPKSLAATKNITSTSTTEGTTKAPNDPSNMYDTSTGKLNPNYNPNAASTGANTFNTGDPAQDALLQQLQDVIQKQQDAGLKLNPDLNFDQATLDKFLETAKAQVHPFYKQQIDTIKQDVLRAAPQVLENYGNDVADKEANFRNNLDTSRENNAGAGLAFSGSRARGELGMQDSQNRDLASLNQSYGNKIYDLGRNAEQQIGQDNVNYNLGDLKNYSANLSGNGAFDTNGSSTPYSAGGYKIGSIQNDEAAAQEARRQALVKSASDSVVAGRSYQDLFA